MSRPSTFAVGDVVAATCRSDGHPPRPTPQLQPASVRQFEPTREQAAEVGARVVGLHIVRPHAFGEIAVCSCGLYAVTCTYVALQHQVLGMPVPWDPASPPTPPRWKPA